MLPTVDFLSNNNNWPGASPDGIVHDPSDIYQLSGLLEINNPFSARNKDLVEACVSPAFCLELDKKNNKPRLKHRHNYYYQIQCQLYCTNKAWCDFVLRTNKDIHIKRIYRDQKWWGVQLEKVLLLPELAVPRYRHGGIREPT